MCVAARLLTQESLNAKTVRGISPCRCSACSTLLRVCERGGVRHAEGGRRCAQFHSAVFRRHGIEERFPRSIPRQTAGRTGLLLLRFYRWLNAANEKLPGEFKKTGSHRHPGPGCEHG